MTFIKRVLVKTVFMKYVLNQIFCLRNNFLIQYFVYETIVKWNTAIKTLLFIDN